MNKTKSKAGRYLIIAAVVLVALVLLVIQSCTIRTPEIHGVVLDTETKQPVAEAWIRASIGIETKTVAGDVGKVISIEPPHLRTDKDGKFVIPSRKINKPPIPIGFGTTVDEFSISAVTVDKSGTANLDTKGLLWKRKIEATVYMKDVERAVEEFLQHVPAERLEEAKEQSSFSGLQALYRYCQYGRSSIETYIEKSEGCDDWELDFAIKKHERFLEKLREPIGDEQLSHYGIALKQLAYLYKMKRNYQKSLELFKSIKEFDEKLNIGMWIKEYETQIRELEQLLE